MTDDGHSYSNGGGERRGNWMQTFTGRQFWPLDPRPDEVEIEDIAHALANACRFAGHCERFYSVAEHSVLVSLVVPPHLAKAALLHDASEAYVVDIPRPLKPYLQGYKEIEERVQRTIHRAFGIWALTRNEQQVLKDADNAVLLAEADQIMKPHPAPWSVPGPVARVWVSGWAPGVARHRFLQRWDEVCTDPQAPSQFQKWVRAAA